MEMIKLTKVNETFYHVACTSEGVLLDLKEYFSFYADNYRWDKRYKARAWDGKISIFKMKERLLYVGLLQELLFFAKEREYKVEIEDFYSLKNDIPIEDVKEFIDSKLILANGSPITPESYQIENIYKIVTDKRIIVESPTGSGKSLIIYLAMRYLMEELEVRKVLIVVPTISLVNQLEANFFEYSSKDSSFKNIDSIHKIWGGKEKASKRKITITTWQSVYEQDEDFFAAFDCVFLDEAHTCKAKSLVGISEKLVNAEYRIGMTGTLDDSKVNQTLLTGLIGNPFKIVSTSELIDSGKLSQLKVNTILLKYDVDDRKFLHKIKYREEVKFVLQKPKRNRFIVSLCSKLRGNSLVLFFTIKYGKFLYESLKKQYPDKKIYYISGEIDGEDRERIRLEVNKSDDCIIVASYGTFSTGIDIRNLHNAVFAEPIGKAKIKILQSIGRILRKADNGQAAALYDLVDDARVKTRENYLLQHAKLRIALYMRENFPMKSYSYNLY